MSRLDSMKQAALQNMPHQASRGPCLSRRGQSISGEVECHTGTHKCSCNIVRELKHPTCLVIASLWPQHTPYIRVCSDTDMSMPIVACATHVTKGHTEPLSYAFHICIHSPVVTTMNSLYRKLSYISFFLF